MDSMTTTVVVEIAPADDSSSAARSMLEACNVAMHPGRCVFGGAAALDDERTAIAIVKWETTTDSNARIDVGLRIRGQPQWATRFLSFSPTDPEGERWRTVGFAIATTVGETVTHEVTAQRERSKGPATASAAADGVDRPNQGAAGRPWIDAQFSVTAATQGPSPAWGGDLRLSSRIHGDRLFLFGAVRCSFAGMALDGLAIVRASAAAGGGLVVLRLPGGVEFAARAQGLAELIDATATDPPTGVRGSGQRWVAGLGAFLDASWMWSRAVGVVATMGAVETLGPTDVTVHDQVLARIPALELDAAAGLRMAWP
jgi:hypothetical protein